MAKKVPCEGCGDLRWPATHPGAPRKVLCNPCRRTGQAYLDRQRKKARTVEEWACIGCGQLAERRPTKGQRPKWCEACRPKRSGFSARKRRAIAERDSWVCGICSESVDPSLTGTGSPWRASVDHIQPIARGGSDDDENLRLAHFWCNCVRSDDRIAEGEFRAATV